MIEEIATRVAARGPQIEALLANLRDRVAQLRSSLAQQEMIQLEKENAKLKTEVEALKQRIVAAEAANGVKQVSVPSGNVAAKKEKSGTPPAATPGQEDKPQNKKAPKESKPKEPKKENKKAGGDDENKPIDISRLDIRVGRLVDVQRHPDADALYIEQVDVGEEKPRTVISGLVKFVPLDQMQNRLALLLCNLKPAKMRGITSEAMVMCASTPEKVEILKPPEGAVPGDRVTCPAFPGVPDAQLNPKKKIWEQVAPDLKVNEQLQATYKGVPWEVPGKGFITAETLKNEHIK